MFSTPTSFAKKAVAIAATMAAASLLSPAMADPLPAGYSPGFTAAKLSTHSAAINKDVSLSVTGMGVCKNFKINWGDSSEVIAEFDFGYGGSLATLTKTHKYAKGGKYYPSVSENFGPSLSDRCGSRTDVPDSSLTITEPGKVTAVTVTPVKTQPGQMVTVKVDGAGQCAQPRRIVTEYREIMNVPGAVSTVKTFAPDEAWPRTASFDAAKEGYYVVYWLGTDSVSSPSGDCISYASPTFVEVKKAGPALSIGTTPIRAVLPAGPAGPLGPNGGGKPADPARKSN